MLDARQSAIWKAMGLGPEWILREEEDPSVPVRSVPKAVEAPAAPVSEARPQPRAVSPAPRIPRASVTAPSQPVHASPVSQAPRRAAQALSPAAPSAPRAAHPDSAAGGWDSVKFFSQVTDGTWDQLKALLPECHGCGLSETRTRTVFADGAPGCPIVMVGEAPGAEEDLQGKPFVGKSGQLLTKALESVGLQRGKDIAIINVLKCRPPHNRDPKPEEVAVCRQFLDRQLELLAPKVLVLMGRPAALAVLGTDQAISRLRGKLHETEVGGKKIPVIVTYHPSYLLRNLADKEKCWHDLLFVKRTLKAAEAA